jgi:hypothetical protein
MLSTTIKKALLGIATAAIMTGCATSYQNLPVHTGTIVYSQLTMRKVFTPSLGGAAVGATLGGVAGNQIGKGNGRKAARIVGILAGAAAGGMAAGSETLVPTSIVTFQDNQSKEHYHGTIEGKWDVGMAVLYSVTPDGKVVIR